MNGRHRLYGLMMGITLGFALWGSVRYPQKAVYVMQEKVAGTRLAAREQSEDPALRASARIGSTGDTGPYRMSPETVQADTSGIELKLHALSAVLIDGDSGRVLYARDADTARPMASTTKIMTCILALENGEPDQICTVSANAASQPKVHLGAPAGTRFYLKDLLRSLMLESHNDSAVAIAEHIGGSVEGFAELMNAKAKEIGCEDTHFITPNGLDAVEVIDGTECRHSTTARDLALIMRYCIMLSPQTDGFLDITRTANYGFANRQGTRSYSCSNHNAFLAMMDGALSGKTGFTNNAGYCYVGALKREDRTFIVALLACGWPNNRSYKWSDTRKLMSYGLEHYEYRDVWEEPSFGTIPVKGGIPESGSLEEQSYTHIALAPGAETMHRKLLLSEQEQITIETNLPEELSAPIEPGTIIGSVRYYLNGDIVQIYPITATDKVDPISLPWCLKKILTTYQL